MMRALTLSLMALALAACSGKVPTQAPTGVTAQGGGATEYLSNTPGGPALSSAPGDLTTTTFGQPRSQPRR